MVHFITIFESLALGGRFSISQIVLLAIVTWTSKACGTPRVPSTDNADIVRREIVADAKFEHYDYEIINRFPHPTSAFTQGLVVEKGVFFEGTGGWGTSYVSRFELETGKNLRQVNLDPEYFGEGITVFGNRLIQLTWQSNTGFVYDLDTFSLSASFGYPTEGWGLTHDGTNLIMSTGEPRLYFLDPNNYEVVRKVNVTLEDTPQENLNELEFVGGYVYANVWQSNTIVVIAPGNGQIVGKIDLTGLLTEAEQQNADVLNGIAFDAENERLFVTGKLWPWLFEIQLVEQN